MRRIFASILILVTSSVFGYDVDDSSWNKVAKAIKKQVVKKTNAYKGIGHCNLIFYMEHEERYAKVTRVVSTGDKGLCNLGKRAIKTGRKFKYDVPEKLIRIQISRP